MYYIHIHCDEELLQWSLISNQKHGMTMPWFPTMSTFLDRKWKHLNCWSVVVTRRIYCWIMSTSNYTPGRVTGRDNSFLRIPCHGFFSGYLSELSWYLHLQVQCTYSFSQLTHTYVVSSTGNNSRRCGQQKDTWPTGRRNSITVNFCTTIKWQWSQWSQQCSQNHCAPSHSTRRTTWNNRKCNKQHNVQGLCCLYIILGFTHVQSLTTAGSLQTKLRATCWRMKPLPVWSVSLCVVLTLVSWYTWLAWGRRGAVGVCGVHVCIRVECVMWSDGESL